nr:helix-turn-helix transcriptional regulator [uncultured Butyrivibrio sp.]
MTIGAKIRVLRRDRNMSQSELAQILGVSNQAISKWEKDISQPDISLLPNIAACFGIAIDDLFEYSKDKQYEKIENTIDQASEISTREFTDMEAFLLKEIEANPENYKPLNLVANLYEACASFMERKSFVYAKRALELRPNSKQDMTIICHALHSKIYDWDVCNHRESIDYWKSIIKAEPKNARAYLYLLDDLMDAGRLREAKETLEEAKSVNTDNLYEAYEIQIEECEHGFEAVADKYRELAKKYPNDWRIMFNVANQFSHNELYEEAITYWLKGHESMEKPRYTDFYDSTAQCYLRLGDKESAIKYYKKKKQLLKTEWGVKYGRELDNIDKIIEELSE